MFRPLFRENKTGKQIIGNNKPEIICGYQYAFSGDTWYVPHNIGTTDFLLEIIKNDGEIIKFYDLNNISENEFTISFSEIVTGKLNVLFYKESKFCNLPFM